MHPILLILLLSIVLADNKHSYSDKCYRFDGKREKRSKKYNNSCYSIVFSSYQYYTDKHGKLLSADLIIEQGDNYEYDIAYYFQYYSHPQVKC